MRHDYMIDLLPKQQYMKAFMERSHFNLKTLCQYLMIWTALCPANYRKHFRET